VIGRRAAPVPLEQPLVYNREGLTERGLLENSRPISQETLVYGVPHFVGVFGLADKAGKKPGCRIIGFFISQRGKPSCFAAFLNRILKLFFPPL
jgi:hypothetical protein